jgi:hypothetical protein
LDNHHSAATWRDHFEEKSIVSAISGRDVSSRRAILDELTARDGQTLFEICARQAISQHLDVLEDAIAGFGYG